MTLEEPRHAVITPDDHGALVAMIAWFLGSALVSRALPCYYITELLQILCMGTRLAVRFTTQRLTGIDDILIVASAVSA
jgi:hypothetical protein